MLFRVRGVAAAVFSILLFGATSVAHAQTVTVAWDPNEEPDVTGYRVYYGTEPGIYSAQVDVGNQTSYTVTSLDQSRNYFFAVQAYAADGLASPLSTEVTLSAAVPPGTTRFTSFSANRAVPFLIGQPVTWTAMATSKLGPVQYRFWLYGAGGWQMVQDYSTRNTFTWTPGWGDAGQHIVQVWARTIGSTASYEAWVATDPFAVNAAPIQLTSDVDFPTPPGNPVTWTATVAGAAGTPLEYKFWVHSRATGAWTVLRDWASSNQAVWTPPTTGTFMVQAWARRVGTTVNYEVWTGTGPLSVARTPLQITSFEADTSFPAQTGTTITWKVRSKGGTVGPIQYQFWRHKADGGWQMVRDYSSSNTFTWTPTWGDEGKVALQVWARSSGSKINYEAWQGTPFLKITRAPLQLTTTTAFPMAPGTSVTWLAEVSDPTATFEYQFWTYERALGTWTPSGPYTASNTFVWTPGSTGTYAVQAWARRVGSSAQHEVWRGTDYLEVSQGPATMKSFTADVTTPVSAGTPVTWTAVASGGTRGPLLYKFWLYTEGSGWTVVRNWSPSGTFTWTPAAAGTYALQVWVRSTGSTAEFETWLGTDFLTILP